MSGVVAPSAPDHAHAALARAGIGRVLCLGKNYVAHAAEFASYAHESEVVPRAPVVFMKPVSALCGPEDPIVVDPDAAAALDYEVELGVVIGEGGARIAEPDAARHVAGYTVVNDLTARDLQSRHQQWFLGKSLPHATPVGAQRVTVAIEELRGRRIRCWVGDELRQDATLDQMVFGVAQAIAAISAILPLEPGDLLAMGTPSGVGVGFSPPRYLRDGDRVRCEIDGIGRLDNTIQIRRTS